MPGLEDAATAEQEKSYSMRKQVSGLRMEPLQARQPVKWFVQKILELDAELAVIENQINQKCQEIPHAGNILEISGIGENILSGILAEMGGYFEI